MDRNFRSWLSIHFAQSYANKVAQRIQYLFEIGLLSTRKTIDTSTFRKLANMNNDLRLLMKKESEETEYDAGTRFADIKAYTMYQTLRALQLYCEFYGIHHISANMVKNLSLRVRNQDESYVINLLLHPAYTTRIFNTVVTALRTLQKYLDNLIHHSFLFQYTNGTQEHWKKTKMVCMVFLEVCLRFFCLPLPTSVVSSIQYYPKTDCPSTSYPYVYYRENGQLVLRVPIKNTTGKEMRMQDIEIPGTISLYLHFYLTRCRNRKSTLTHEDLLFMRHSNKNVSIKWETIVPSVRQTFGELGVNEASLHELGLAPPGSRYEYVSKVLFAITKTYQNGTDILDVDIFSKYMYMANVGLTVSQSSKYYSSMDQLRTLRSALTRFGYTIPTCGYVLLSLPHMRKKIRSIFIEEIRTFIKYRK